MALDAGRAIAAAGAADAALRRGAARGAPRRGVLGPLSTGHLPWLRRVVATPPLSSLGEPEWREHVGFHAEWLEHPDPFVAEVAYGAIARAPCWSPTSSCAARRGSTGSGAPACRAGAARRPSCRPHCRRCRCGAAPTPRCRARIVDAYRGFVRTGHALAGCPALDLIARRARDAGPVRAGGARVRPAAAARILAPVNPRRQERA
jgi:hypothetical protein